MSRPQLYEIYTLRQVKGLSLIFLSVDITGGVLSALALFFRKELDIVALVRLLRYLPSLQMNSPPKSGEADELVDVSRRSIYRSPHHRPVLHPRGIYSNNSCIWPVTVRNAALPHITRSRGIGLRPWPWRRRSSPVPVGISLDISGSRRDLGGAEERMRGDRGG